MTVTILRYICVTVEAGSDCARKEISDENRLTGATRVAGSVDALESSSDVTGSHWLS